jgi:hypothetical protein
MKKNILLVAIVISGLAISSCKKKKDDEVTPAPIANGTLFFHIHTNVDTTEVENYGSLYTMSDHRKIIITKAQLYISGVQLVKLDGSTIDVQGVIKLTKNDEEVYQIGSVPAGNYKSVKFNVGLNSATNAAMPAVSDSTLNQPPMWFGSTAQPSGFVFVNFEGLIDTSNAANGTAAQMQPFSYKIGTNANIKTVTMPDQNYTVSPNQAQYIHLVADYNMLFMGFYMNVNSNLMMNTNAANATPLGIQIANNIPTMFSYEM